MANIYGVRKVNEQIFSAGREPVITELDDKQIDTKSLTEGTLRVNKNADLFIWKDNAWKFCDNLLTPTKKTTGSTAVSDDTQNLIRSMKTTVDSLQQKLNTNDVAALRTDVNNLKTKTQKLDQQIPASKIDGVLNQNNIPDTVKKHLVSVADAAARKKLTSSQVQVGDTVYEQSTGLLYLVKDQTFLHSDSGYIVYTASLAQRAVSDENGNRIKDTYLRKDSLIPDVSHAHAADLADQVQHVTWKQIEGKPSAFAPEKHTQGSDTIKDLTGYQKNQKPEALSVRDSLNTALAKLEAKIDQTVTFSAHTHDSSTITKLKGYEKQATTEPLNESDSMNTALGKLEFRLDHKAETKHVHTSTDITSLAGFRKFKPANQAGVPEDISEEDTLNTAIAKLEYAAHQVSGASKIVQRAISDEDGNNIKATYATKAELAKKVNVEQIQQSIPKTDDPKDKTLYIPTTKAVREHVAEKIAEAQKEDKAYTDKQTAAVEKAAKEYTDACFTNFLQEVLEHDYFKEQERIIIPYYPSTITEVKMFSGSSLDFRYAPANSPCYVPDTIQSIIFQFKKDGIVQSTSITIQDMPSGTTRTYDVETGKQR